MIYKIFCLLFFVSFANVRACLDNDSHPQTAHSGNDAVEMHNHSRHAAVAVPESNTGANHPDHDGHTDNGRGGQCSKTCICLDGCCDRIPPASWGSCTKFCSYTFGCLAVGTVVLLVVLGVSSWHKCGFGIHNDCERK